MQRSTLAEFSVLSRSILPVMAVAVLAASGSSHAAVLAAWDDWSDTTSAYSADTVTTGFTATVSTGTANRYNAGFGSTDGNFGSLAGASTGLGGILVRDSDGSTSVTIVLNNGTGSDYSIDSLHFDFGVRIVSPRDFTLTYVSGGLGPGNTTIDTQTDLPFLVGASQGASEGDYADFDYTLSSFLTDTTLGDGESATFSLVFSNFGSSTGSSILDNVAFQGNVIPEPSAAMLGLVGALGLLRRRRR